MTYELIPDFAVMVFGFIFMLWSLAGCSQQQAEPWKPNQLMAPASLAALIQANNSQKPLVLGIGFGAPIKGSIEVGATNNADNLKKLKTLLEKEKRDRAIVIYCGCCPFRNCPNIRPAFSLLNSMGFTKHQLLNLATNVKVDWIDKGYPVK